MIRGIVLICSRRASDCASSFSVARLADGGFIADRTIHWNRMFSASTTSADSDARRQAMVNKLLYRSRQRGFLELDLMMGLWAEKELPKMTNDMLQHFSRILDMENPDLFKWLTGQIPTPEEVMANPAYRALASHVKQQLGENSHEASLAAPGKAWVRGWDDSWRKPAAVDGSAATTAQS